MATDKETIESLRNEIDYLKSKNEQMLLLMRKNDEAGKGAAAAASAVSAALSGASGASGGGAKGGSEDARDDLDVSSKDILTKNVGLRARCERQKYLRSLFFNYLCSRDRNARWV